MIYSYFCEKCNNSFEKNLTISERNIPILEKCPLCNETGHIKRVFESPLIVSGITSDGPLQKTDSGWNDTLKRIKAASGKNNTIQIK